jgi:hypothetical protein
VAYITRLKAAVTSLNMLWQCFIAFTLTFSLRCHAQRRCIASGKDSWIPAGMAASASVMMVTGMTPSVQHRSR